MVNPEPSFQTYLRSLGATEEQLDLYRDELGALGLTLILQPGDITLTVQDLARQSGLPVREIVELRLAMGLPNPPRDEPVASDRDVSLYTTLREVSDLFGYQAILALSRVIGTSTATIAEAATSAFLVNVDFPYRDELGEEHATSPEMLELTGDFVDRLSDSMDVTLRHHLVRARRKDEIVVSGGFELQDTAVGFADLVNSTGLGEQLEITELGRRLMTFEGIANSIVTQHGARTVKLIGDEVMFTADDAAIAVQIGIEIARTMGEHPGLPDVRVGVAAGQTLLRDGDLFGPTVNLAARLASSADPTTVLVATSISDELDDTFVVQPPTLLRLAGFSNPIPASIVSSD